MPNYLINFRILITFAVALINYTTKSQTISVTPSVTTINANSVYSFIIFDNNLVSRDGTITIGFPSSLYTLSSLTCYNTDSQTQIYPCTVSASSKAVITYTRSAFPSQLLSISISTIRNPSSKQDLNFTYQFSSGGTVYSTSSIIADPLTPDSLVSCSIVFSPATVFTEGSATFNLVVKNALAASSSVSITFPSVWSDSISTSSLSKPISSTTVSCTPISTNLKTSLTCDKFDQNILASGITSTSINSNAAISFSAIRLRAPPTTSPQNKVTIQTLTPAGFLVDQSDCLVNAVSEQTITLSSNTSYTVGEFTSLSFSWVTPSPLKVNDTIILTLPNNYMAINTSSGTITIFYQTIYFVNRNISVGNSSLQYRFVITSINSSHSQISVGMKIQMFTIVTQCLIDASPRQINIQVSRNGYFIQSGTLTVTPNPNSLTSVTIASDNYVVSSPMRLNITFKITNTLLSSSKLRIQIPSTIQLTGSNPVCSISSSVQSAVLSSISCTLSSYVISIPSFLQNSISNGTSLSVIIENAFINPLTTQPTSAFIIGTQSSASYFVDRSSNVTYTSVSATIGNLTIVPSSYQVLNTNTYLLTYTLTRTLRSSSMITVVLPTEIQLSASASFGFLLNNATAYTTISPTISVVSGKTQLNFSGIISTQMNSGSVIKIQLRGLINPKSLKTTSSFNVYTSYGVYQIQKLTSGLTVTMTTLAQFSQFLAVIASPMNGATRQYTFYIKPLIQISTGDILKLQIVDNTNSTNQITFASTVTCNILYGTVTLVNSCSVSGQILTIVMAGALTDTTGAVQYRLVVSSLILARTYKTSSIFALTSSTGGFGVQTKTVSSVINTSPNNIQSLSLKIQTQPSQLNQYQQLKLTIKTFNGIRMLNGQYFVIQVPSALTYKNAANVANLCTTTIFNCTIYNSNNNMIKVTASSLYTSQDLVKDFVVTLHSQLYVSPTSYSFTSDYFYFSSYTDNNLLIDNTDPANIAASKATFYLSCGGKCATCPSSNVNYCDSCYNSSYVGVLPNVTYGGFNTMTSDHFCVDVCSSGYFNKSGSCQRCISPCSACTNQTACTTCETNYYFYSTNSTCLSVCPTTPIYTYADSSTNTCRSCSANCFRCSGTSVNCTACNGTLYLSGSLCLTTCPDGTFQNTVTNKCQSCDVGCSSTCQVSATNCTSACKTGYFRPSAGSTSCVNFCPSGSVLNSLTSICQCSSSCKTCSGTLTNCTSCETGTFLYNNNCIGSCPAQTYQPVNGSTCLNCIDTNCSVCTASTCLNCSASFYLYAGMCTKSCPSGTRLESSICVQCPAGCNTCRLTTTSGVVDCTSCQQGYLIQANECVTTCTSPPYINFNASSCVTACPSGYINNNNICQIDKNNTNNNQSNNNSSTNNTTTTVGRIVPFPYTITYVLIVGVSIGMRCLYPSTLLPSTIMSFGSIIQTMSALTLIIVAFIEFQSFIGGIAVVVVALVLIYLSNFASLFMIIKILSKDQKFTRNYKKKVCPNIIIRIISVLFYHKFHQIVFSNIFGIKVFCNKVDYVKRLYPFNILLIISLFLSLLIIIGASVIGYQVQTSLLSSSTFIQSIDCILIVVLNVIPTILVLRRKDTAYQNQLDDRQVKRYETQDQLNMNNDSQAIQEVFIEEGGDANGKPSKVSQRRKNYYYQNSKRSQVGDDPYETPLDKKRLSTINPITGGADGQQSSEALFFGKTNPNNKSKIDQIGEDVQQIVLQQPTGDNQMPNKRKILNNNAIKNNEGNNSMINYTGYDLDPRLLQIPQNSEEFKKLPSQLKAKIRLAKANMQINKNSSNLKNDTIDQNELDQIQLSPKRNTKEKFGQQLEEDIHSSRTDLLNNSHTNKYEKDKQGKSKSLQKNRDRNKSKSPGKKKEGESKQKDKDNQDKQKNKSVLKKSNQQEKDQIEQQRMVRNASQQMKKKQSPVVPIKTTKSQNIKKKKKKPNNEIKVLFNGAQINGGSKQLNKNQQNNQQQFQQQDEPRLPVFKQGKHNNLNGNQDNQQNNMNDGQIDIDSDGLDNNDQSNKRGKKKGERYKRALPSDRKSQNFEDQNVKNLRDLKGQRTIPNQQPDDLPKIHSSQQLGNLVIVNRAFKNKKNGDAQFQNDDSSIYKKIYNDDTQTLKSVQGDNYFSQQISPSHFNVQNQRFQQTQASNDMPIPPTFDIQEENQKKLNPDGFDQYDSYGMKRYSSNHNIDYDSVLSKRINDGKIKELQKIYLPRLEVVKPKRKKK